MLNFGLVPKDNKSIDLKLTSTIIFVFHCFVLTLAITKIQENKNLINAISHKELSKAFLHVASKNMANFKIYTVLHYFAKKKKLKQLAR